ncbi:hypothetical protein AS156_21390 [Bradyrhizobium macuxiense]|uniref:LysM domain-containing protein n=1 Tax=Bradyrhizobium macuxiense TaxID=1755647 RepID=A0A109JC83_9BRAD|nr:hypothetical protein AS156_21390 [Bradyrhizobium macuxiense]
MTALVAGGIAALIFGMRQTGQMPLIGAQRMASASVASAPDRDTTTLTKAQAETAALANALAEPSATPAGVPEFDVVNVEPTGEAVVAGHTTPGATVELLRNGEVHDQAVADKSGQFVMVPRPLPPGNHDLTLRIRRDGKDVTSTQRVAVAIAPTAKDGPMVARMTPDRQIKALARSAAAAGRMTIGGIAPQLAAANAAIVPDVGSPSAVVGPRIGTTTVSRGDSLWRISHRTLGAGQRYALIYRANKQQIRNPNLIYPGQVFVLPTQ